MHTIHLILTKTSTQVVETLFSVTSSTFQGVTPVRCVTCKCCSCAVSVVMKTRIPVSHVTLETPAHRRATIANTALCKIITLAFMKASFQIHEVIICNITKNSVSFTTSYQRSSLKSILVKACCSCRLYGINQLESRF